MPQLAGRLAKIALLLLALGSLYAVALHKHAQREEIRKAADDGRSFDSTHDPERCPILRAALEASHAKASTVGYFSNSPTRGPVVSQPEVRASATALRSASQISCRP